MLYREIIAVCFEIHAKPTVDRIKNFWMLKLVVHKVSFTLFGMVHDVVTHIVAWEKTFSAREVSVYSYSNFHPVIFI